ncbi:hypothetical protein [Deinococcus sp. QL22]|uniref:hypothetical protein n=1 Tax=Deinococcus sp. QL22 TaxID=2939437 RepID=UPI002017577B|nr:hypothetical protein [Deinococcus sp. QL22]UQN06504.1 hypothetical protein M1R55_00880 [Deinococcus sp. QL22]
MSTDFFVNPTEQLEAMPVTLQDEMVQIRPRPIEHVQLAKEAARTNFINRLHKEYKYSLEYAKAIGRIVVDPTAARHALEHLQRRRIPSGTVYVLNVDVFTPGVSVNPVNPRETERRAYQIEKGSDDRSPLKLSSSAGPEPMLLIRGKTPAHIMQVARDAGADLRNNSNTALKDPIWMEGIREPLLLFVAQVDHEDGSPSATFVLAADGSSRTAHSHEFTSTDEADAIYRWPQADPRQWSGHLGSIIAVQDRTLDSVSEHQLAAHRALVAPASIVIKVDAARPNEPIDAVRAYRSMIGAIHVSRPKDWGVGAENDEIATAILDALEADGKLNPDLAAYLSGTLPANILESKGFSPHTDVRGLHIMKELNRRSVRPEVSRVFCSIRQQKALRQNDRSDIVAELMLRAVRDRISQIASPTEVNGIRSMLQRTVRLPEWRASEFKVTKRSPETLRDEAIEALKTNPENLSTAALELGLLGVYWLVVLTGIKRETTQSPNKVSGAELAKWLMSRKQGIYQLYQAVIDGRTGRKNVRYVDPDGNFVLAANEAEQMVSDTLIREKYNETQGVSESGGLATPISQSTPRQILQNQLSDLNRKLYDLKVRVAEIEKVNQDGKKLVDAEGIPYGAAEEAGRVLDELRLQLLTWGRINKRQADAASAEVTEDGVKLFDDEDENPYELDGVEA